MNSLDDGVGASGLFVSGMGFAIVLVVSYRVLPAIGFAGTSRKILAVCVAALSAVGVLSLVPSGVARSAPESNPGGTYPFLLLPYAALGLALLVLLLLAFAFRWVGAMRERRYPPSEKSWPAGESRTKVAKEIGPTSDRDMRRKGAREWRKTGVNPSRNGRTSNDG